jgi:hypothetical protein
MLSNSGLPPNAQLSSTLVAHDAVMRGRARALPFFANKPDDKSLPPPGAVLFLDFAGMMIPSRIHRFRCYLGIIDKGSNWRRLFPGHTMTSQLAAMSMDLFLAELSSMMGLSHPLKPHKIVTDQGSAFMAVRGRSRGIHLPTRHRSPFLTPTALLIGRFENMGDHYSKYSNRSLPMKYTISIGTLPVSPSPKRQPEWQPSKIQTYITLVLHAGPRVRHPVPPWHHLTSATLP